MTSRKKPKGLPKAVLNLSHLSSRDKIAGVQAIITTAAASPALKASAPLQQAQKTLAATHDDVVTALAAHDGAKKTWLAAEQDLLHKESALVAASNAFRDTVNAMPGLDEPTIASLGLKVAGQKGASRAMIAPDSLVTRLGKQPGEIDVQWKPVTGAKTYLVQTTEDAAASTGWANVAAVTKAKVVLKGLTSGKRTWIRVATVGSNGMSAYGSPVAASVA